MKLFSVAAVCGFVSGLGTAAEDTLAGSSLAVGLTSQWSVPFHLRVIESIANVNESWYQAILRQLMSDEDEGGVDLSEGVTDHALYHNLMDNLDINEQDKGLIDYYITSNFYSPRVQSHYEDYHLGIDSKTYPLHKCSHDSFGKKLNVESDGSIAWVLTKDRVYCSPDDLFALQLTQNSDISGDIKPYDRVVGSNSQAPLVIIFGNFESEDFAVMLKHVYESALAGKLRFVWRYTPGGAEVQRLAHYGARLEFQDPKKSSVFNSGALKDVNNLGLKLVSAILQADNDEETKYQKLRTIIEALPAHIDGIAAFKGDTSAVKERVSRNIELGTSEATLGIYVNGAVVNKLELDSFKVLERIKEELSIINGLIDLGFDPYQAKHLLKKFALHSAVNQVEYNSGRKNNRYKVYEDRYDPSKSSNDGGVVYINDLETDENYQTFLTSREKAYIDSKVVSGGQMPPLRENIHDLIFVINLYSKEQLNVLFTFSKLILDKNIPQQIGILPLATSELERKIAKYFYFLYGESPKEALAFLYKVFTREDDSAFDQLFSSISADSFDHNEEVYEQTLRKFSLTKPSVIFNGVIKDLRSQTWQLDMGRQLAQDVITISTHLRDESAFNGPLRAILYEGSASSRNLHISPEESFAFKYKKVTKELLGIASSMEPINNKTGPARNVWVIGSSTADNFVKQCQAVIDLIDKSNLNLHLKFIDVENKSEEIVRKLTISRNLKYNCPNTSKPDILATLSDAFLPASHTYVLFGSRYVRVEEPLSLADVKSLIFQEKEYTTGRIQKIFNDYSEIFISFDHLRKRSKFSEEAGWYDLLHSVLLKSFFKDDETYVEDVSRYDLSSLDHGNSMFLNKEGPESFLDLQVVVDPLDASSQEYLSIINSFIDFPSLKVEIMLQPKLEYVPESIKQYFKGLYPKSKPGFAGGRYVDPSEIKFDGVSPQDTYRLELVTPKRWQTSLTYCPLEFDADKIKFDEKADEVISVGFELTGLLIEGYAKDIKTGLPANGTCIQVSKGGSKRRTNVLKSLGYFQLPVDFGTWKIQSIPGRLAGSSTLLSASSNPFEYTSSQESEHFIHSYSLDGVLLRPLVKKLSSSTPQIPQNSHHADINIFTIASGHQYEKLAAIMVTSIMTNTKQAVKFWFIDTFSSPQFKALLPRLAEEYRFSYEFVSYKWPMWLRKQDDKHRTVWGYKVLFLDLLFPEDLDRVIFVDADQINRSDMMELVNLDMNNCPYGFVPMCESREETKGFRFWKTGYWAEVLKNRYKYHISALFVVDLKRFKELSVGDKLRSHYQKLSSDPNSLSNLDQDLPNNLQGVVPIYSLPQNYLWCETWCSDSELKSAKNIDLCNNPLTKEDKIATARRLIPEWKNYEKQVEKLWDRTKEEWNQNLHRSLKQAAVNDSDTWEDESDYEHDEL